MFIKINQTLTEVFQGLKKGILDWIPNEILDIKEKFWMKEEANSFDTITMNIGELTELLNSIQNLKEEDFLIFKRPDCLNVFLLYIKHINGGQISDSGLCVITTEFFNELVKASPITEEILIDKLRNSYHKTISLYFDGGKPNLTKGLFKQYWINENKLKFVVC